MTNSIGELLLQSGNPLLKMWSINISQRKRSFVKHSHTRFEITVINSGSGEYTTENGVYPIREGDVFVFSSNEIHSITEIGASGLSITNLHFEPRYLIDGNNTEESFINFCFSHSDEFKNRIPAEKAAVLRHYHTCIKEELLSGERQFPLAIRSYLNLLLIELLRNHRYQAAEAIEKYNRFPEILKVYDYIEKHFCEELSLDELSDIAGLSPNYFSHLFKEQSGISLWDYITAKRVEKAVSLIRSQREKLTVLEIALNCGFNNTVNFNKAFKKQTGITPSELRKNPKLFSH